MPFTTRDNVRLYWKLEGQENRPALLLLNSIGTDMSLWDAALPALRTSFRLLRTDMRGHGASDAPEGDYSLPMLAADAAAILDEAGIAQAAVAGVSLGGMTAMQLALDHPGKISALALICTSAQMDPTAWETRIGIVRGQGTAAIADMALDRLLSPAFAARHPEIVDGLKRGIAAQSDTGYAGAGAAIRDMAVAARLGDIRVPALVVTGESDISTPFAGHGDRLLAGLQDARHAELASAHLPPIEAPSALAAALQHFLLPQPDEDNAARTLYEAGLRNRRRILGDAWVDKSLARRTTFNTDFQAMITRIAWQEIWSRSGLDDRTRRLLVLAVTASLGRWEEFVLHVRAGLTQGGFTQEELKETLMQIAIYAGVPSANTAFAEAGKIIADFEGDGPLTSDGTC